MTASSFCLPEGPIAYLTGQYPRATDTFIQREVFGLRDLGIEVITCSIRRTGSEHHIGPEQQAEARSTFCVLEAAANPITSLKAHGRAMFGAPTKYFSALWLALRTRPAGLKGFLMHVAYFAESVVLASYLARNDVRHLHNHIAEASCTVAMLASEVSGIPYSFTLHGPSVFFEVRHWRLDEKIARAKFIVCISEFSRSQAMLLSDRSHWSRIHIVHCGVDPDLYDHSRPNIKGNHLIFVGRLSAAKGVYTLLEAFRLVHARIPDATLTLVGDGEERTALEKYACGLELKSSVNFTGYLSQTEVAEKIAHADLFILPSFSEGLPVVLMEALASRVPVVATRIAGVSELVEDGVCGVLVSPGNVKMLAEQVEALLTESTTRTSMGEAGRERVVKEFNIRLQCKKLANLIEKYQTYV